MSSAQKLFPVKLWPYIEVVQKPFVQARMSVYNQEIELARHRNNQDQLESATQLSIL